MAKATIVVDLGFGDAGKGSIVDFLSREYSTPPAIVRFNGGAQAAHNVVTPDGRHHTFAHFGSGTLMPGVLTHFSEFALIDPINMVNENVHLKELGCYDAMNRLSVSEDCLVVTPFQKTAGKIRDAARGKEQHGTCGMGIGETMMDDWDDGDICIRAKDLKSPKILFKKVQALQHLKLEQLQQISPHKVCSTLKSADPTAMWTSKFEAAASQLRIVPNDYLGDLADERDLIFEGAQGVLLDEWYGFHPHTTWSTCTFANADELLHRINYHGEIEKLGVMRADHTRHGPGPFPTESAYLGTRLEDQHNIYSEYQGTMRFGWLDLVLAKYALDVVGDVDSVAITCLDHLQYMERTFVNRGYDNPWIQKLPVNPNPMNLDFQEALTTSLADVILVLREFPREEYVDLVVKDLGVKISIESHGPTADDKRRTL